MSGVLCAFLRQVGTLGSISAYAIIATEPPCGVAGGGAHDHRLD